MKLEAFGNYVIVQPSNDKTQMGGLDLIAAYDNENRYLSGVVVSAGEGLPLETGDIVYYDKQNNHGIQHGDYHYLVLTANNIVGVVRDK